MHNTIQRPVMTAGPVRVNNQPSAPASLFMSGLLLLVSIPAGVITCVILLAMLPIRFFGTLLK